VRALVAVAAIWVGCLAGCLDAGLVECADGRLCPAGTACDVAHGSCVAPDQLSACDGLPDLAACTATGIAMGRCFDGVCLPSGCGNAQVEPEELCDDGNAASGDGCAADCQSREVCGDGFADKLRGEQCDDGNPGARDGCTNACTLERPTWHMRLLDESTGRTQAGGAYDELYDNVIVFGGLDQNNVALDDTWGVDAAGWSALLAGGPAARRSPAVTYDPLRQRVVMFGGFTGNTQGVLLNDTWEWSGAGWQRKTSTSVPPARVRAALAWDGARVILFGGSQIPALLADTWAWDGETWTRLQPANAPLPRDGHAMVFDPKHARIVLFGGNVPVSTNDTWFFDGTDWQPLVTASSVPPRLKWGALAYDAKRGVVVLSGVSADTSANVLWELDDTTWLDRAPSNTPAISGGAVLAYDHARERVVQLGGKKLASADLRGEAWEWDGTQWTQRTRPVLPAAREQCAIASDPVRGRVVMFGGQGASVPLGDTWEWDGARWRPTLSVLPPPARLGAAMTFDGEEVLMFGGSGTDVFGDTRRFDGTRWQTVATTGPDPRFGAALAYDTKRDRVWLFGGSNGSQLFADLWQWDGTAWSTPSPMNGPTARTGAQLAYDIKRDVIVMFGGTTLPPNITKFTDTWEWDGTAWKELKPTIKPEARAGFSLVYDRRRERVMLFGGVTSGFSQWEWDGAEWMQPEAVHVPVLHQYGCATYDDARGELVAFGGVIDTIRQQYTITGSYRGEREEVCRAGGDIDRDNTIGCDDDDCRAVCAPLCWEASCTKAPRCGDGACSTLELEAGDACAADCP
jgi:cysteine-rich repeat protein